MGRASRESPSHRVTESQSHRVTESQSHRVTESPSHSHIHLCLRLNNQRWRDFSPSSSHYSSFVLRSTASPPTDAACQGNMTTGRTTAGGTQFVTTASGKHATVGGALFIRRRAKLVLNWAAPTTLARIVKTTKGDKL